MVCVWLHLNKEVVAYVINEGWREQRQRGRDNGGSSGEPVTRQVPPSPLHPTPLTIVLLVFCCSNTKASKKLSKHLGQPQREHYWFYLMITVLHWANSSAFGKLAPLQTLLRGCDECPPVWFQTHLGEIEPVEWMALLLHFLDSPCPLSHPLRLLGQVEIQHWHPSRLNICLS